MFSPYVCCDCGFFLQSAMTLANSDVTLVPPLTKAYPRVFGEECNLMVIEQVSLTPCDSNVEFLPFYIISVHVKQIPDTCSSFRVASYV